MIPPHEQEPAERLADLIRNHWDQAVAFASRTCGNPHEAEDLVQEALVRLWDRHGTWDRTISLPALFFRIVRNVAIDHRRRRTLLDRWRDRAKHEQPSPTQPDQSLEEKRLSEAARRAVDALPPRRRDVFLMIRVGGLSHAEVAEALGLRPQTVANHMGLALKELRRALDPLL